MARIRIIVEGLDQETADQVKAALEAIGHDIKVTIGEVAEPQPDTRDIPEAGEEFFKNARLTRPGERLADWNKGVCPPPYVAELTPELEEALRQEMDRPGPVTWVQAQATEPRTVASMYSEVRCLLEEIMARYDHTTAQLWAEGAHTAAATAEVDRLNKLLEFRDTPEPVSRLDDV